jgi:hypothetical protein
VPSWERETATIIFLRRTIMDVRDLGVLFLILVLFIGLAVYFIPAIIASARRKRNWRAIFALNLLAGWTIVGWIGALVWSLTVEPPVAPAHVPEAAPGATGNVALKLTAAPRNETAEPHNRALSCQVCGRIAWSFCTVHGVPVCEAHLNAHDTPQCSYVPSGRVQVVSAVPAQSGRKRASSILGLG